MKHSALLVLYPYMTSFGFSSSFCSASLLDSSALLDFKAPLGEGGFWSNPPSQSASLPAPPEGEAKT